MKTRTVFLSILFLSFLIPSCKKDKADNPTPPGPTDEMLNPANAKLAHYLFNGNIRDTSGNGHHEFSANVVHYNSDRFGRANRAFQFQDSFGYVPRIYTSGLDVSFPFSVSLWINPSQLSGTHTTLLKSDFTASPNYYGYWLQIIDMETALKRLIFSFGDGTSNSSDARNSIMSSVSVATGNWYHVVINVRGKDAMDIYINGVKDNAAIFSGSASTIAYTSGNPVAALGMWAPESQHFWGKMDDLRVYSRELSEAEISSLYSFQPQ